MDDHKLLTYTLEKLKGNFATANVHRILLEEGYDADFAKKICRCMFEICEKDMGLYDKAIQDFIDLSIEFIVLQSELEKTGRYKYNNFEEVEKSILENKDIMPGRYLNGLLFSQAFWLNHYKFVEFFKERFCVSKSGGSVLEVPIGTGLFLSEFMKKNEGWTFKGFDLSTFSVNFAVKYISINNDRSAEISKKNLFDIEENNKFDKIICGELMEHLDDPRKLLLKLKNLLKNDGEIFLTTVVWLAHIDHIYLFRSVDEIREMVEPFFDIKEELILPLEQAKVSDVTPINYAVILKHKNAVR
ncbi:MAG: methyltransferase domain-containing protein [Nanoarchaeota archaeon]